MYRVGFPFWKAVSRMGMPVRLRVIITRDEAAGVYIATSPDLDGLVVEAASLDELRTEALGAAEVLLELEMKTQAPPKTSTEFTMVDRALCAA